MRKQFFWWRLLYIYFLVQIISSKLTHPQLSTLISLCITIYSILYFVIANVGDSVWFFLPMYTC